MSLNPIWTELGVRSTSVLNRTLTKNIHFRFLYLCRIQKNRRVQVFKKATRARLPSLKRLIERNVLV